MAKYQLSEPAFIDGVHYIAGTIVDFPNDLPSALGWIALDDDAKRNVDAQNKKRLSRGVSKDALPNLVTQIENLKRAGFVVTQGQDGTPVIDETETGQKALIDDGTLAPKAQQIKK
jgi:hypothetical protein